MAVRAASRRFHAGSSSSANSRRVGQQLEDLGSLQRSTLRFGCALSGAVLNSVCAACWIWTAPVSIGTSCKPSTTPAREMAASYMTWANAEVSSHVGLCATAVSLRAVAYFIERDTRVDVVDDDDDDDDDEDDDEDDDDNVWWWKSSLQHGDMKALEKVAAKTADLAVVAFIQDC
eukprot:956276-Amphidinium_carterae.1